MYLKRTGLCYGCFGSRAVAEPPGRDRAWPWPAPVEPGIQVQYDKVTVKLPKVPKVKNIVDGVLPQTWQTFGIGVASYAKLSTKIMER